MLNFIPTLHSDLIETKHKWTDQCHYFSKRTITNISFYITKLQGTNVSMSKLMKDTKMTAVLTYLCTLCFLLRASD